MNKQNRVNREQEVAQLWLSDYLTRVAIKSSRQGKVGGLPERLGLNLKKTL